MDDFNLIISNKLEDDTKLYRYISLSMFLTFIEKNQIYLTKMESLEDTWEIPLKDLPIKSKDNELKYFEFPYFQNMFTHCWSLEGNSDALWRIYSKEKEGILIETTVKKFKLIKGIKKAVLAPVIYYNDLEFVLNKIKEIPPYDTFFGSSFLKRNAFKHEKEVRLVTLNEEGYIDYKREECAHINFGLDSKEFIENIIIDPRADDWYVDTIKSYCLRVGLSCIPKKSDLYSKDIFKSTGVAIELGENNKIK